MISTLAIFTLFFILMARVSLSERYRFYYFSTVFITVRLWIALFAGMYLSTQEEWMWEIEEFSIPNSQIFATIFSLGVLLLFIESFTSSMLFKKRMVPLTPNTNNLYVKYGVLLAIVYVLLTAYMYIEISIFGGVAVSKDVSKFNYIDFLKYPFLYKIIYAVIPFLILSLAYVIVVNNFFSRKKKYSVLLYSLVLLGVFFHVNVYGMTHTKSHFIVVYLMFFIIPIYYLNRQLQVTFFKNKIMLMVFFVLFLGTFVLILYQNFGSFLIEAFLKRLSLEGQLLYMSLQDFYDVGVSGYFFRDLFDARLFVEILMYNYLPITRIEYHEETGWLMSGSMPGGVFLYSDFLIGLVFWVLNFFLLTFFLKRALDNFETSSILLSFINLKLAWFVAGFIAQGSNYLFSVKFWGLVLILIFISLILAKSRKGGKGAEQSV